MLEEEKNNSQVPEEEAPFIKRGYFKEVFDKYKDKLKCEVELTSSDD